MPRTVDHIVATHEIARARVRRGQPAWVGSIDIRDAAAQHRLDQDGFAYLAAVAAAVKSSRWHRDADEDAEIRELVEEIEHTTAADGPDTVTVLFTALYDLADVERWHLRSF